MRVHHWARTLGWIGVVGMMLSVIDPMEGAFIALPFGAVLTAGAFLSQSRYRVPLYWAFGSMTLGVAVLATLSAIGGIGGKTGHSVWWGLLLVPYPLGWLTALVYGVRLLREPIPSLREKVVAG